MDPLQTPSFRICLQATELRHVDVALESGGPRAPASSGADPIFAAIVDRGRQMYRGGEYFVDDEDTPVDAIAAAYEAISKPPSTSTRASTGDTAPSFQIHDAMVSD